MATIIDSTHPIEIDGTKYRLAESDQGAHYDVAGEPLRPPNAVTIQGESSQKFQVRPDMLLWTWTDWSQGEGQRKLKFGESGRSWQNNGVRVFEEPGHLIPGYYMEATLQNGGAGPLLLDASLVVARGKLYAFDSGGPYVYEWNTSTEEWSTATTLSGVTYGALAAIGDRDNVYWLEGTSNKLWKWNGTTATAINTTDLASTDAALTQVGPYVYVSGAAQATPSVWEVPKTGASAVQVDAWTEGGNWIAASNIVALDGKIYVMVTTSSVTAIREIIPSSAAGAGFGAEVARIQGFVGESIWSHSGSLFVLGSYDGATANRTVLYLVPGEQYGTLGEVRDGGVMGLGMGGEQGGRMLDHFWVQDSLELADTYRALMQIDSVSGGVSCISVDRDVNAGPSQPSNIVSFDGDIFHSSIGTQTRLMRSVKDQYMKESNAISSEHDFDLASAKYLGSLTLACEPLPADWTLYVDYQINGSGSWVTGVTYTTDSGTGVTTPITTDSATVEFNTLQLRVRFSYTGSGIPTSAPVLTGIEARAGVVQKVEVFRFLLDLSDDHSGFGESRGGASKAVSFLATARKTVAVDLKDGYMNRNSGVYSQYDVMVDDFRVILDKPGEGVGVITLREVV